MSNEKNELSPSVRERIRKEAEAFSIIEVNPDGSPCLNGDEYNGYIAGAESEHPKAIAAYREGLREKVKEHGRWLADELKRHRERGDTDAALGTGYEISMCQWFLSLLDQPWEF